MTHVHNTPTPVRMMRSGFTLIELVIAILIIGLITGGAMYWAMSYLERARRTSTQTTMKNLQVALLSYQDEKGEYPQKIGDLVAAGLTPKPLPKDGWNRDFYYKRTPDGEHPYELYSYGKDGKKGGKAGRINAWKK